MALLGWYALHQFQAYNQRQAFAELSRVTPQLALHLEENLKGQPVADAATSGDLARFVGTDAALTTFRIT
ncbi:MAG TPA: hypothetical protein VG711_05145, partial [Phycisphaerales bacterium]|nr:hypothetical protein [Phycisphaerales bacterium]